jgi:hypothetical protein
MPAVTVERGKVNHYDQANDSEKNPDAMGNTICDLLAETIDRFFSAA